MLYSVALQHNLGQISVGTENVVLLTCSDFLNLMLSSVRSNLKTKIAYIEPYFSIRNMEWYLDKVI